MISSVPPAGTVDLTIPREAWGRCLIESAPIAQRDDVLLVRVHGWTWPLREHWAVFYPDDPADPIDGRVFDLTARQFHPYDQPTPWEGRLDDWLDDCCEWLNDALVYEVRMNNLTIDTVLFKDTWGRDDIDPDAPFHDPIFGLRPRYDD